MPDQDPSQAPSSLPQPDVPPLTVRQLALVFLMFTVLTTLATWPLALHPNRVLIGTPGDSLVWPWNFTWTRQAIVDEHRLPFFSEHTFMPFPSAMLHHTHTFFYGLVYCLGALIYENPFFWANAFIFSSFVLAGCGAFLLARRLTGHTPGALLAGAVYAYCSLRLGRISGHLNILSGELIPWYLYFLFRGAGENRVRFFAAAGICFAATTWNDYYNSLFIILFTLLFMLLAWPLRLWRGFGPGRRLAAVAPALLLAALLLAPFAWGLWQTVTTRAIVPEPGGERYYVTLANYLVPAPGHRLFGNRLELYYMLRLPGRNPTEATVFFGYTAILLALYGVINIRPKSGAQWYFIIALVFFLLLSFGPTLRISLPSHVWLVPLPYRLLHQVPFLSDFRVPARFGAMVALCAAVLAAWGLREAFGAGAVAPRRQGWFAAGLILLVLIENLHAPYPQHYDAMNPAVVPQRLLWKLRSDPVPGAVLKIPPSHWDWTAVWMQILHRRPSVTGVLARPTQEQITYYYNLDLHGWFRPDPRYPGVGAPAPWTREQVARFCYFFDLRALLISPFQSYGDLAGALRRDLLPLQAGFSENKAWLGLLEKQPERFPIVIDGGAVADNYYFTEHFTAPVAGSRWMMGPAAQAAFRMDAPRDLALSMELGYPFHLPPGRQRLTVRVGGRLIVEDAPVAAGWSRQRWRIPRGLVRPGYNYIGFETADWRSPAAMGIVRDTRPLAVMVRKMTIEPADGRSGKPESPGGEKN